MKKSETRDITIRPGQESRMVGDVTKIGVSDTAQSGADGATGDVQAPKTIGQPSGAPDGASKSYSVPTGTEGDANQPGKPGGLPQPDCGTAPSTSTLQQITGKTVGWPSTADGRSASPNLNGGTGLENSEVTGSKVAFPPAADNSMQPKDVESFIGPK